MRRRVAPRLSFRVDGGRIALAAHGLASKRVARRVIMQGLEGIHLSFCDGILNDIREGSLDGTVGSTDGVVDPVKAQVLTSRLIREVQRVELLIIRQERCSGPAGIPNLRPCIDASL